MRIRQLIGPDAGAVIDMVFADALACIRAGTAEAVADSGVVNDAVSLPSSQRTTPPVGAGYLDRQMVPARRGRPPKSRGLA